MAGTAAVEERVKTKKLAWVGSSRWLGKNDALTLPVVVVRLSLSRYIDAACMDAWTSAFVRRHPQLLLRQRFSFFIACAHVRIAEEVRSRCFTPIL